MAETIDTLQNLPLSVTVSVRGHVVPPHIANPAWSVDNQAVGTIAAGPDGSTALLTSLSPGTVTVSCQVGSINAPALVVTVTDPVIDSVSIAPGSPVDK